MTLLTDFSEEVALFLTTSRMASSRFGRDALGDPGFVAALRKGRCPNLRTIERARAFIDAHKGSAGRAA
jgi:hypothetical protein